MRRLISAALVLAVLGALVWSGGLLRGLVGFFYGWVLFAYLFWRAWPAVRADLSLVGRRLPRPASRRVRGGYL